MVVNRDMVIGLLNFLRKKGLRKVHFSGGEVLLLDFFPDILRHSNSLGLQVNFTTNGTLIDSEISRLVIKERVHAINVSVDSPDPKEHDLMRGMKGSWKTAWKGIENLKRKTEKKGHGPLLNVNTIVTRKNIDKMPEMYKLLLERGINRWRLLPVDTTDAKARPSVDQWKDLLARLPEWKPLLARMPVFFPASKTELTAKLAHKGMYAGNFFRKGTCFAPWFNLFVDATGAVFPCCMGKCAIPAYGNLKNSSIESILASPSRRELLQSMAAGKVFEICHNCDDFIEENEAFDNRMISEESRADKT